MARPRRPVAANASAAQARGEPGVAPNTSPGFHTRAMPPIRNPVYAYNYSDAFKVTPQPVHALERPGPPRVPAGIDPRLTVQGDTSRAVGLSPIQGMAYQTPWNVWGLFPA